MRKNVLVVGVPRSGTSLTESIFANKCYFVAGEPDSRDEDEPASPTHAEASSLLAANVQLLSGAGYVHENPWMLEPITETQAAAIPGLPKNDQHRAILDRLNAKQPWIWKDPRLCYTLGYWWPMMNPETTGVLFQTRNV